MSRCRHILILPLLLLFAGCTWSDGDGWKGALATQLGQVGYKNWIVVAEASFPAHSRAGIRQVNAYRGIPEVVDEVLRTLERTEHVRPRIYVPRELSAVENDFAPGIDQFRAELEVALHGHERTELDQESLVTLIQSVQRSFDVLVIRTNTALPYTSVFMELQPGYWDGESERRLRQRMERLASPQP